MKPMFSGKADLERVRYPVMASPKLDGFRCLIIDGVAMSRNLKPIPNRFVQSVIGRREFEGLDGELAVGPITSPNVFNRTQSGVTRIDGEPDFTYHVFDVWNQPELEFDLRWQMAAATAKKHRKLRLEYVPHVLLRSREALDRYEERCVAEGYEGIMLRDPKGPYKCGRSTVKEGWLLKVKRFEDSEAEIVGFKEELANTNKAKVDNLGHQRRSSKKAGMVGKGALGALVVRDLKTGVEFDVGSGFTQADRETIWRNQEGLLGATITYTFQPAGVKEKPRFPVFKGFRDPSDL